VTLITVTTEGPFSIKTIFAGQSIVNQVVSASISITISEALLTCSSDASIMSRTRGTRFACLIREVVAGIRRKLSEYI
jgi:hypothetical protein